MENAICMECVLVMKDGRDLIAHYEHVQLAHDWQTSLLRTTMLILLRHVLVTVFAIIKLDYVNVERVS
jgi:hypothetical protein